MPIILIMRVWWQITTSFVCHSRDKGWGGLAVTMVVVVAVMVQ